jgi:hypothetical protein
MHAAARVEIKFAREMMGLLLLLLPALALDMGAPARTTRYWDCCKPR